MEEKIVAEIEEENEIEGVIELEPLRGAQGYSAYEIYLKNIPEGETPMSEQEWLDALNKANYYKCFSKRILHLSTDDVLEFIPIESYIAEYNSTCILEVFINGFKLQCYGENNDYNICIYDKNSSLFDKNNLDKEKTYIQLINPINTNEGIIDVIDINVFKSVVATNNDYDLLKGEKGSDGKDGLGVPAGGTTGQVLAKKSDSDNDTEWVEQTGKAGAGIAIGGDEAPADTDIKLWFPDNVVNTRANEIDLYYPVGTYYETSNANFNPNVEWGGTWEKDEDGTVLSSKTNVSGSLLNAEIGSIVGEDSHTLTVNEMPSHAHSLPIAGTAGNNEYLINNYTTANRVLLGETGAVGGGQSHNNIQKTKICIRWHRIA